MGLANKVLIAPFRFAEGADMFHDSPEAVRLLAEIQQAGSVAEYVRENSCAVQHTINEFVDGPPILIRAWAKDHVQFILKALIRENRPTMFARMLASLRAAVARDLAAPRSPDPDIRFGYRLAYFLIGIGGAAIAQALRSYGETRPTWKIGLGDANDAVDPMDDAAFEAEVRRQMPPHMVEALDGGLLQIEPRVGTGKYLDVHGLCIAPEYLRAHRSDYSDVPDGAEFVVQLVKPGAAERADEVLAFTLDILEQLSTGARVANVDVAGLVPIIQSYRDTLGDETNLARARRKSVLAVRAARKCCVDIVDNTHCLPWIRWTKRFPWIRWVKKATVCFDAAAMYEAGNRFRVCLRMRGAQFKDMPETSEEERQDKFFVALSLFTRYFLLLLSGEEFNHDPHGANNRATILPAANSATRRILVGEYDELGYCERPTASQKETFAHMLMDAVGCALFHGIDLAETIKEAHCKLSKTMSLNDNVCAMLKTLLMICEYQAYINKYARSQSAQARVYCAVVQAVAASGAIDPVIRQVISSRFRGIHLLLKKRKPASGEALQLLAEETRRFEQDYPIRESKNGLGAQMAFIQRLIFDWVARNIQKGQAGVYRIVQRS